MPDQVPPISTGSARQRQWAADIRDRHLRTYWPAMDEPTRTQLLQITSAQWWIVHREILPIALSLPPMTGGTTTTRREATRIRAELISKRWGVKIPPGIRETLDRLTDSEWWVRHDAGDGYPQAIDRAFGAEAPELERNRMALPKYGRSEKPHTGECEEQQEYAYSHRVAFERASETGDLRIGRKGEEALPAPAAQCCRSRGFRRGEKEGKQVWLERRAAEIHQKTPRQGIDWARSEARSQLTRLERNLDGWG